MIFRSVLIMCLFSATLGFSRDDDVQFKNGFKVIELDLNDVDGPQACMSIAQKQLEKIRASAYLRNLDPKTFHTEGRFEDKTCFIDLKLSGTTVIKTIEDRYTGRFARRGCEGAVYTAGINDPFFMGARCERHGMRDYVLLITTVAEL